ncbi:GerAB/ArcD/ProY family transporter [Paenibacillus paeoniae]|uniref:Spore gernimation protein KC n=1 Tax=Paenibacillus paeoniae TaxID=2292705 RepID=A0A371PM64_9BACL|nr:endospore germination permease [Paenibacillus paeoniae]REK76739.1 spore gernimation protein KC [Paenibacillus paeoniae]
MENNSMTVWQFFVLTLSFLAGTSFFFLPGGLIAVAKQDAWMVPLWAGAAGVMAALIWLKLARQHPGLSIIQICTKVAGKPIGGLFAIMYISYFIQLSVFITRNVGDFMKQTLMPITPLTMFHVMLLVISAYAVVKGIDTIARSSELLFIIMAITFVLIFCMALVAWDWSRFQGSFRMNVWETLKETRYIFGFPFLEALVFLMLFPFVQSKVKRSFILAIVVATLLLSVTTFFTIGVLGVPRASHDTYPLFVIAQEVHVGTFFEHLESTIALILLAAIFIKLSIAYYCSVLGLCQLFRISSRLWVTLALILLISGLSLGYDNVVENIEFSQRYDFEYTLLYSVFIPCLLLFVTWIRKKVKRREGTAS